MPQKSPAGPKACMIWMHGLGADSADMAALASQLSIPDGVFEQVFLDAQVRPVTINGDMPMRAWYDITGTGLTDREDSEGIKASEQQIIKAIERQQQAGFASQQIFLAGFSQGAAMALYTGLHASMPLGGIVALSGYLPLALTCRPVQDVHTAFFLAHGRFDSIVLPAWSQQSGLFLKKQGYVQIHEHEYAMEHTVCHEELRDLSVWLIQKTQGIRL